MQDQPSRIREASSQPGNPTIHDESPTSLRRTTWTLKQNLARIIWGTIVRPFWYLLPAARPQLIRLFGGHVGRGCRFSRTTDIYIPWTLSVGNRCRFGERSILYSLGKITIGDNVVLDYKAHLCAGTHDMNDLEFPLLRAPITIGNHCVIGADAFIGPGVSLGPDARIWPRSSVYADVPAGGRMRGNPARLVETDDANQSQSGGETIS